MRACLAISSFRNDESVLRLLEHAASDGALEVFGRVIVVDSIGTGQMRALLNERGFDNVEYHCEPRNLGSAGNLAMRLAIAAEGVEDVVYAVNHDGSVERTTIETLLVSARRLHQFGALYPLRALSARRGRYDVTGRWSFPVPSRVVGTPPAETLVDVWWSSSNPALYSLAPVRDGLLPWADLWMGWEDLGYGWLLARNGHRQYIVTTAVTVDGYEMRPVAGGAGYVTDKPAWYTYYMARNLVLVAHRTQPGLLRTMGTFGRIAIEAGTVLAYRSEKRRRLRYLAAGFMDGLDGRTGKWDLP